MQLGNTEYVLAGTCAIAASLVSLLQILYHLRWYSEPYIQRFIIRIILMIPLYALLSFISLLHSEKSAVYLDALRDCYEAYVIYNFLSLCYAYVGGPGAIVQQCDGVIVPPAYRFCTCCLPVMEVDGTMLRRIKQGAIQFVVLKPIITILIIILEATGKYCDGDFSPKCGYLWIQIMYNISYTVALYALLVFYLGAHDALEPYSPLLKFILVKAVVFLTFWQGLFLAVVSAFNEAVSSEGDEESDYKSLQNFLICLEMFFASIMMMFAFPWREYRLIAPPEVYDLGTCRAILRSLTHAVKMGDVFQDTYHQFSTRYQTYVAAPEYLHQSDFVYNSDGSSGYSNGVEHSEADNPSAKKSKRISSVFLTKEQRKHTERNHEFSVRTFVLKGQEMMGVRPQQSQEAPFTPETSAEYQNEKKDRKEDSSSTPDSGIPLSHAIQQQSHTAGDITSRIPADQADLSMEIISL